MSELTKDPGIIGSRKFLLMPWLPPSQYIISHSTDCVRYAALVIHEERFIPPTNSVSRSDRLCKCIRSLRKSTHTESNRQKHRQNTSQVTGMLLRVWAMYMNRVLTQGKQDGSQHWFAIISAQFLSPSTTRSKKFHLRNNRPKCYTYD